MIEPARMKKRTNNNKDRLRLRRKIEKETKRFDSRYYTEVSVERTHDPIRNPACSSFPHSYTLGIRYDKPK